MRRVIGMILLCGSLGCGGSATTAQPETPSAPREDVPSDREEVRVQADAVVIDTSSPDQRDTDRGPAETSGERQNVDVELDDDAEMRPNADGESPPQDTQREGFGAVETPWGLIDAPCGFLGQAIAQGGPSLHQGRYVFEDPEGFDETQLVGKPKQRFEEPNAGGSSRCGEVMSMQYLIDCEGASVTKTEVEMVYDSDGKIVDYLADLDGVAIGVSVTRAYKGPVIDVYSEAEAVELLTDKLNGLEEAADNISEADAWSASMLHVWTLRPDWAEMVGSAWESLAPEVKRQTHLVITIEQGGDYIVTDGCDD